MTTEQLEQIELQRERVRNEIIDSKIFLSYEELDEMSQDNRINAIIQMKQDETMRWQRLVSKMYYYITVSSFILGALGVLIFLIYKIQ
jgi:hypothetical protein